MACDAAAADHLNPMKPIPPERREAILARLGAPAHEPVAREKFAAVLHCAGLSAHGLSEYCRRNGLYLQHDHNTITPPDRPAGYGQLRPADSSHACRLWWCSRRCGPDISAESGQASVASERPTSEKSQPSAAPTHTLQPLRRGRPFLPVLLRETGLDSHLDHQQFQSTRECPCQFSWFG
ncbi:MAG: hypothetical protein RLZZ179_3194 [Verrucomicrobiota bacterium]|jgi:hypothetical protein